MPRPLLSRRRFLGTTGAAVAALGLSRTAGAADSRPAVTNPRATDGDKKHEPDAAHPRKQTADDADFADHDVRPAANQLQSDRPYQGDADERQ